MTGAVTGSGVSRLGGLAKTSLREQALDVLRNAVTSGEIAPGNAPGGDGTVRGLSISRGTLREALRQLEQEGLVEPSERGRLRVRTLSAAEIEDMFEVRSALEGLAAALLCRHARTANRCPATANRAGRAGRGHRVHQRHGGDRPGLPPHPVHPHRQRRPAAQLGRIAGSIRMSIMFAGTDRALSNMSVPRHQVLVDAVAAGDPDQARIAVDEHMREAASNLMTESDTDGRDTA